MLEHRFGIYYVDVTPHLSTVPTDHGRLVEGKQVQTSELTSAKLSNFSYDNLKEKFQACRPDYEKYSFGKICRT